MANYEKEQKLHKEKSQQAQKLESQVESLTYKLQKALEESSQTLLLLEHKQRHLLPYKSE